MRLILGKLFHVLLLLIVTMIYMAPFFWMISTSLKPNYELYEFPPKLIPSEIAFDNYPKALKRFPFFTYFRNSLIITGGAILGTLISCPLVAYGLSIPRWRGRELIFYIILATIMLPSAATLVPTFLIFSKLKLVNTFWPLILPSFFGQPFYIFLIRQFFLSLPRNLFEAAKIDGASEFQIYLKIALPLIRPILVIVALFQFIASWNDYLGPLVYLTDESKYPLALGLPQFLDRYGTLWNQMMAAATIAVIPTLVFFIFAQKQILESIKFTGLKG
ncbi:binding-protein-dependent transport systems inner membrane component [Thermotoga sp. Mc24]|uniref:carbohydrate ABC transporter permease n=1 Tax=Thermotoga sp. Mc24 TaxID=1231241 RepID=UPI000543A7F9|nr:carbohydrate ABC transporter permease [Thermotoga sp. Mc24]KHC92679.1 binding-protein-dependent transport systems inner membrane component [Thermotoga sp. Mc24]